MLVQAAQKIYCDLQLKVVKCVVKNWEFSKFWPSAFLQQIVASVNKTAKTLDVDIFVLLGDYLKLLETMEGPIEHSGTEAKEKRGMGGNYHPKRLQSVPGLLKNISYKALLVGA